MEAKRRKENVVNFAPSIKASTKKKIMYQLLLVCLVVQQAAMMALVALVSLLSTDRAIWSWQGAQVV